MVVRERFLQGKTSEAESRLAARRAKEITLQMLGTMLGDEQ